MKKFSIVAVLLLAATAAADVVEEPMAGVDALVGGEPLERMGRSLLQRNRCGRNNRQCCDTSVERRKCRNRNRSCYNDRCVRCGGDGQRVCKNGAVPRCQDGLAEQRNRCQMCGGEGMTCCPRRSGLEACENEGLDCRNNRCRTCGGAGERQCSSGPRCQDGLDANNGQCEEANNHNDCGSTDGDCCVSNDRRERCSQGDQTCEDGNCVDCGRDGEVECNGRVRGCLGNSLVVRNGLCVSADRPEDCGGTGEDCCNADNSGGNSDVRPCNNRRDACIANTCVLCGVENAQPCPDDFQDNDGCVVGLVLVVDLCIISTRGDVLP